MAGSQDPNDNPVGINVVPMVDVIFCLCVFFMCSMKFKEMEGKFDSWLPTDKGQSTPMTTEAIEEIRVMMQWNPETKETYRQFGKNVIKNDDQLQALIKDAYADAQRMGHPEKPVIIDAGELVPWKEVVNVVNLSKREGVDKIEFAAGKDYDKAAATKK